MKHSNFTPLAPGIGLILVFIICASSLTLKQRTRPTTALVLHNSQYKKRAAPSFPGQTTLVISSLQGWQDTSLCLEQDVRSWLWKSGQERSGVHFSTADKSILKVLKSS